MKDRRDTDSKLIEKKICQSKYCKEKAYAITKSKFLCRFHFREINPMKEKHFRYSSKNRANFEYTFNQ